MSGETAYLDYRVEIDASGEIVDRWFVIKTPENHKPTPKNKKCGGCGGEKFDPPTTGEQIEDILRDHIQ